MNLCILLKISDTKAYRLGWRIVPRCRRSRRRNRPESELALKSFQVSSRMFFPLQMGILVCLHLIDLLYCRVAEANAAAFNVVHYALRHAHRLAAGRAGRNHNRANVDTGAYNNLFMAGVAFQGHCKIESVTGAGEDRHAANLHLFASDNRIHGQSAFCHSPHEWTRCHSISHFRAYG